MNFVNSMAFTAITFVAFTALVALISWWKTRGDNLDTQDGYYLGGRSLTGPVIAGSLLMTNLSAEQLVGNNGQAVRVGMSTMGWEVTSAIALVILAFVLMPKYLKTGLTTVPQFFEQRYDEGTRRLVSIIVLLSYVVIMLPNILYAGAQVFVNIFGIDKMFGISRFAAIAIVCVATAIVGSIYAIFGGLKAIALSDSINGLGLIVGGLLVPVFGFMFLSGQLGGDGSFMDGFDKFLHTNPSYLNAINEVNTPEPWLPWPLLFTGLLVNNMYYWATNQSIIQRTFGAKNLKEAQKGAVFAGFLKIMTPLIIVVPGVICALAYPGTDWGSGDSAYPMLVAQVMPKPILGFFAAVMFGAILSSFNSVLNSVNTMFTMDIYKEFINKNASESKLVSVGKNIGIVFAIFSVIVGPMVYFFPAGLKTFLDSFVMLVGLPVLSGVFGGFFFNCLPKYSARFIMVFHIICYGGFMLLSPSYSLFGGNEGSIHYLYAVSILWPLEMLIMYLMHRRNKSKGAEVWVQQDVGAVDLTPWKYRHIVSIIGLLLALGIYILFSPLGIAA